MDSSPTSQEPMPEPASEPEKKEGGHVPSRVATMPLQTIHEAESEEADQTSASPSPEGAAVNSPGTDRQDVSRLPDGEGMLPLQPVSTLDEAGKVEEAVPLPNIDCLPEYEVGGGP